MEDCKYRLPCNWCDKFNKFCDMVEPIKMELQNGCKHEWHLAGHAVGENNIIKYYYYCSKCEAVRELSFRE